jgi:type VI secretion system protein ImpK
MTSATLEMPASSPAQAVQRHGQLALTLQEAFTVGVRLRTGRQVAADATSFRAHVKTLLGAADGEARKAGYDGATVKLAIYAYIAFLDESVLNSGQQMFAGWPSQPLQEEIFGDHVAGETFFQYLSDLMRRQDSEELADLLEVYLLCMLLGFRGRYGADPAALQSVISMVQDKVRRIRGSLGEISPAWGLPADEAFAAPGDPWMRRLLLIAGGALVLALVLYVVYLLLLRSGVGELDALASRLGS